MSLLKKSAGNNQAYFKYSLKHNWQHLVFYMILMLLVVVLPTVMIVRETVTNNYYMSYYSYESRQNDGNQLAVIVAVLTFISSCAVSVFSFMSAAGYVNSKQAVGCFHSFPLTRSFLFFTETGVKAIYFLLSLGVTALLSNLILRFNFPVESEANVFYFQMLLLSVLAFCLFFAIGMLAAGLSGTGLLRFLMFCLIVGLPIAAYALICASINLGMPDVYIDPYLEFDFIKWLCPITFLADIILRLAGENGGEINFGVSVLLTLIPIVVFYGGALLLHLKRRSETSGTSIIWKPVFGIIKYAVIFLCTLGGGLFFGAISGDMGGWYFFGSLCGLLLSFMLANVILYRSVRSMFKGVRGLCAMAVVMVLFSVFTVYDAANMNAHVWSAGNTRSVTLTLGGVTVTYTDDEDIDTLVPMLREFMQRKDSYEYSGSYEYVAHLVPVDQQTAEDMAEYLGIYETDKYYEYNEYYDEYGNYYKEQVPYETTVVAEDYEEIIAGVAKPETVTVESFENRYFDIGVQSYSMVIRWRQMPVVGILSSKSTHISYTAATKPLIEFIIGSEEYAAAINGIKDVGSEDVYDMSIRLFGHETVHFYSKQVYYNDAGSTELAEAFTEFLVNYEFTNEKRRTSPLVGYIMVWSDKGTFNLPVYAVDYKILNTFGDWYGFDFDFKSADDVYEYLTEEANALFLIDRETFKTVSITDREEKNAIIRTLPHTEVFNRLFSETDGDRYLAVAVHHFEDGVISSYVAPIRPGAEELVAGYFPHK